MPDEFSLIGKRLPRVDAVEKVRGEAEFTSDIKLPSMLYAKFLRSPHAHAKIISIDTVKAEALPGVKAVLTYQNVPKVHPVGTITGTFKFEYLLDETVHYSGEEVAAVAAVSGEIAEEALDLITVEYEVLPAVFDKEEAMQPGAPLVHPENGSNLIQCPRSINGMLTLDVGDIKKGFAEADYIVEGIYESPLAHPSSPEPRSVVCQWRGDKLTCWASTQQPQKMRLDLAHCLGIPLSSVIVISKYSVGGFGAKDSEKTATLTALLAKRAGNPVKAVFTRGEELIGTHRRIDAKFHAKLGVKKDGTISAVHTKMITSFGRDSKYISMIPCSAGTGTCSSLYMYHNSRWENYNVITNIEDHGAMNGFGDPESGLCIELLVDEAAEKLNMDPVDFRLKNCTRYGERAMDLVPVMFASQIEWDIMGTDIDSLQECIRQVAEKSGWKKKWRGWQTPMEINGSKRKGIGIALGMHHCIAETAVTPDSAIVKLNLDGSADVMSSGVDIGQGLKTAMAQVVAEVLGIQIEDVNVILADTSVSPWSAGIFGNRGMSAVINAAWLAAKDARRQLLERASERLGTIPEELSIKDRKVFIMAQPDTVIPVSELCQIQITGNGTLERQFRDERSGKVVAPVSVAATIVEVEVDTDTGQLGVLSITSAHDCGRAINPTLVENQINTSLTMGNGYVRTEDIVIDKSTGAILNPNLLDYKIMTFLDMPQGKDIKEIPVEFPTSWGPFGAKGFSETACTTPGPAIANAIYNAIGVRIREGHFTPQVILKSLGKLTPGGKNIGKKAD